ncbi:hypothetical protein ISN44_As12g031090 [Arabidopsis suecica]|uniref:Uncharacterized protein n=1 Tax=Arabidopsis suecica TaxID=45249 RepID=A0A8T1YP25_ARASU|nr:hypothetical protein ISN44_As12g031090 [Arabidopsis suecica]
MDPITYTPTSPPPPTPEYYSSDLGSPVGIPYPESPNPHSPRRLHSWIANSKDEKAKALYRHVEYEFVPEGRDFLPGTVIFPETFFASCPVTCLANCQSWIALLEAQHAAYAKHHSELVLKMQAMERAMRRLEAHPKEWVNYELYKLGEMSPPLRAYCAFHDGSSCNFEFDLPGNDPYHSEDIDVAAEGGSGYV